jgi:hypothetical protein
VAVLDRELDDLIFDVYGLSTVERAAVETTDRAAREEEVLADDEE